MKESRNYEKRKDYLIKAVKRKRKKIRMRAIAHLGGKCSRCGYSKYPEILEFHHRDPNKKDFGISLKGYTRS